MEDNDEKDRAAPPVSDHHAPRAPAGERRGIGGPWVVVHGERARRRNGVGGSVEPVNGSQVEQGRA